MRTYPMKIVVDGREVNLLVRAARRIAFVFVDGTPLGPMPLPSNEAEMALDDAFASRLGAVGLDAARFRDTVRDALVVESRARSALKEAIELGAEGREGARTAMTACVARWHPRTEHEREIAARVRARIDELALRFA